MTSLSSVLRRTTLVLTSLFVAGGLLFALGYAFEDPGGVAAVLLAVGVVVPLVALTVLAVSRRSLARQVLALAVVLYAAWGVVNAFVDLVEAPDIPVLALMLALPISVVGLTYPLPAGFLLLGVAAVPFLSVVVRLVRESGAGGPGPGDLLGGSTGVVVVPLVALAALLLVAGGLERATSRQVPPQPEPQPPRTTQPH